MSYPINLSFKDEEFEEVNKAARKDGHKIRDFIKNASIEKAATINKGGD